jgi:hypothetical protein
MVCLHDLDHDLSFVGIFHHGHLERYHGRCRFIFGQSLLVLYGCIFGFLHGILVSMDDVSIYLDD